MAKKKKKVHHRPGKNLFSVASKDKSFRAAKRAEAKAAARKKKAWKRAVSKAKRKIKKR